MIITDPDPASPTEQSPLKSAVANASTSAGSNPAAPPPPYTASSAAIPSYQSTHTPEVQVQVHTQPLRPRTAERFLKAFAVAVLIIFLWGTFIDSLDMLRRHPRSGRRSVDYKDMFGVDRYVRRWWYDAVYEVYHPSETIACPQCQPLHAIVTPERILSIDYPPPANKQTTSTSASVDAIA